MPRNTAGYSGGYREDYESRYDPDDLKNTSSREIIQSCWERDSQPLTGQEELQDKPIWNLHWRDQTEDHRVDKQTKYDRGRAMLFASDIARDAQEEIRKMDGAKTNEPTLEFIRQKPHDWEEIIGTVLRFYPKTCRIQGSPE